MPSNQKHISEDTIQEIISKYDNGAPLNTLSKLYKLDRKTIRRYFNKRGVKRNEFLYQKHRPNKYFYNKEFFHNIDTPEKAYVFGL